MSERSSRGSFQLKKNKRELNTEGERVSDFKERAKKEKQGAPFGELQPKRKTVGAIETQIFQFHYRESN